MVDTRILGMTILGAEPRVATTHPPSPSAFRTQAVALARTSGKGMPQPAYKLGILEEVLRDVPKRAGGDGRRARRVDDGGAG